MNWKVREVPAGEFKAKCLQLMDEVNEEGIELVITKRGRPVAKLVPVTDAPKDGWGSMLGRVIEMDPDWWKAEDDWWGLDVEE